MNLGEKWEEHASWLSEQFSEVHKKLNTLRDRDFAEWADSCTAEKRVELARILLDGTSYGVKPK